MGILDEGRVEGDVLSGWEDFPAMVRIAIGRPEGEKDRPRVLAVEPVLGKERQYFALLVGNDVETFDNNCDGVNQTAEYTRSVCIRREVETVVVDQAGLGSALRDALLRELPPSVTVLGLSLNQPPYDGTKYYDQKAELWGQFLEWIKGSVGIRGGIGVAESLVRRHFRLDGKGRLRVIDAEVGPAGHAPGDAIVLAVAGVRLHGEPF